MNTSIPFYVWIVIGIILIAYIGIVLLRKKLKSRVDEILKNFRGENIKKLSKSANFFGLESEEKSQVRGNGVLMLTDRKLIFKMWFPDRKFEIPLSSVREVKIVKSHLGKSKIRPLVKVIFNNERGEEDSMAWLVRKPEDWKEDIESVTEGLNYSYS